MLLQVSTCVLRMSYRVGIRRETAGLGAHSGAVSSMNSVMLGHDAPAVSVGHQRHEQQQRSRGCSQGHAGGGATDRQVQHTTSVMLDTLHKVHIHVANPRHV